MSPLLLLWSLAAECSGTTCLDDGTLTATEADAPKVVVEIPVAGRGTVYKISQVPDGLRRALHHPATRVRTCPDPDTAETILRGS